MRSNPGIMLLQTGTIKGKWSYANYPDLASLKLDYSQNKNPLFMTVMPENVIPDSSAVQN
jgi:hypothetical protein